VNTDTFLKLQLDGKEKLLPPDEIVKIVDAGERFNQERQDSPYYRILGTINPLISNPLFNITGTYSWQYLNNALFMSASGTTYADSIKANLKEIEGWFGYFSPIKSAATLCNYYDMEPKRDRFLFIPDVTNNSVKNWELTVTYPYTADTTHNLINGGILIVDTTPVVIGGRDMVAIGTPIKHNLNVGRTVRLSGTTIDGEYEVVRLGLDDGSLTEYYFCLDIDFTTVSIGPNSRMIRLVSTEPSTYYFRKFKKIKTKSTPVIETDDYEVYNLGFSENLYKDNVNQFVFNEDIDVSDLTDNLGRPLSELYLTVIKTDSNKIFTNVSSGLDTPFISNLNTSDILSYLRSVPVIQKIHNGGSLPKPSHTPLENSVLVSNSDFYGDVVEYNKFEVKETVLGEVAYRFNTLDRETSGSTIAAGPRQEGYYYKAHHLIKIRDFSSYIEQGDKNTVGMPDYTQDLGDGRFLWRDLLEIGTNDIQEEVLDYPFLNGCHYRYANYILDVRRQDPFDNWDLYYSTFPADPIGNTMNNKFKVNLPNNVC
jgi:hypothetical protein